MISTNNNWKVYIHIVPKDISGYDHDKYYVGITSQKLKKRWGTEGSPYKNKCKYFYNAIQKYGWNNMQHFVFASNINEQEAKKMERTLISLLDSHNKEYGYNLTMGGDGMLGYRHTEDAKKRIGEAAKGNQYAKGWNVGNQYAKGNKLSLETRQKMGRSKLGNTYNGCAYIRCVETGEIKRTNEWIAAGYKNAYNTAKGRQKTCGGYHFEYVNAS